ncbi:histidine phosphatase family protein [Streptomyces sp. CT34]|uniref:histidine phosphatase family protein n=1 Tax=Streptomyces sp. CT34 TaxID=1553907 RepID=UPI0007C7D177|nr:histidine phosphatase family protein [Streptomyces sp. CT34]
MTVFYLVQHAEKERRPGDPGLTKRGRRQAASTADWLQRVGVHAVFSSPLRRARETASFIASSTGLRIQEDTRLRERMSWDGTQTLGDFLADWGTSVKDRDFVPASGDSSNAAAERLRACLVDLTGEPGPLALVTHGGVTVDLLRTLIGDPAVPVELMQNGVPSCAITTLDGLSVVGIASVAHLGRAAYGRRPAG